MGIGEAGKEERVRGRVGVRGERQEEGWRAIGVAGQWGRGRGIGERVRGGYREGTMGEGGRRRRGTMGFDSREVGKGRVGEATWERFTGCGGGREGMGGASGEGGEAPEPGRGGR